MHIINLALTVRAAVDLTEGTIVRYTANYDTTKPVLGVVLADVKAGELASIGVKGIYQIKVNTGATFAPGDPIAANSTGLGITGSTGAFATVLESSPTMATIIL